MSLLKELDQLLSDQVISQETAKKIRDYYSLKESNNHSRLFVVFGVLGAILVGLGIILIIGHNWDDLSRLSKTIISFVPLVTGHLIGLYVLLKKPESTAWREGVGGFLFFAVGASIALISQVYNLSGSLSSFMLTWMLISLPMVYVLKSSINSLLYIVGITYYASIVGYFTYRGSDPNYFWFLLLLIIPYYYLLYKRAPKSNFMTFHNWLIPLSIVIVLGTYYEENELLIPMAYMSLFGFLYMIGNIEFFNTKKIRNNGYIILGSLGSVIILLIMSFDDTWTGIRDTNLKFSEVVFSIQFAILFVLALLAAFLFYKQWNGKSIKEINPIGAIFIGFLFVFLLGFKFPIAVVLDNLLLFTLGVFTIRNGIKRNHLGVLNYGLLIITALVISRFFDSDLSFVTRGILFIGVGVGFFVVNYQMLKKRKQNEE